MNMAENYNQTDMKSGMREDECMRRIDKKRTGGERLASLVLVLCLFVAQLSGAAAQETDRVRVGWCEGSYNITGQNGERRGYNYEYQQGVAGYTGWEYEYVEAKWADLLQMLRDGEIDLMSGLSYTEERAQEMLFSDLPMAEEKYYLYADVHGSGISADDLSTLRGKRIGILEEGETGNQFDLWEKSHRLQTTHVTVTGAEDIRQKLAGGEIDGFVLNESPQWTEEGLAAVVSIGSSYDYFAINKNRPDLKEKLDRAMRRLQADKPFYADELYERYLSDVRVEHLTYEERCWLDNHGAIRIGYLNDDPGVSFSDPATGELTGVIRDYVTAAENCLHNQKLEFALFGYDNRAQQLEALHNGEIDLIFHVSQNPYSAETNGFSLSDTVWSFSLAALTVKNGFDERQENVAAVTKDNFALKAYIHYNYPNWNIAEYHTEAEALKAVREGKADCFLTNSAKVSSYLVGGKLQSVFLTEPAKTSFAVRRGEATLLSILNKTLKTMSTAKLSGAVSMYGSIAKKVTLASFVRDNAWMALGLLAMIAAVVNVLWIQSRRSGGRAQRLNVELGAQKAQLEKALTEAKKKSQIIGSISQIYSFIYRIDLQKETYEEISPDPTVQQIAGASGLFSEVKNDVIHAMVAEEYRDIMEQFMDLSTIPERLRDMDSISIEYRTTQDTWQMAQLIAKNRDENGEVTDILYTVRQIDKQKQLENKYKQQLLFSSRVLTGLSIDYTIAIVLDLDTDSYEIAFNQSTNNARRIDSITSFREYVDRYVERFVLPPFRGEMRKTLNSENIRKRFATEKDFYFSFETMPNAAGLSCFQVHVVREYDEGGHLAFLGFRSVDDAIRQEREYKRMLQEQLNRITAALPGGVKISNDDETYSFRYVSEQFATMLGYDSPEDLINTCDSIVGLVHPDDFATGLADALDQYSRSDHYATTYRVRCKDGSYKYIEDRGQKVIGKDGTIEHWNLILDKNDLMEKSIALESEKKANQSKSAFLARMSHDMRTPLNGIVGLMKINLDHLDDTRLVMENYRKMQISADHLLGLINDVLQMSKIEDGTVSLSHEIIDFTTLPWEITAMIEQRAADGGIALKYSSKKKQLLHPYVYGSPLHLRQIFLNIYNNCIKFNHPGGSITTAMDYEPDGPDRCIHQWVIMDTGIGMSKEFLKHIFEPFVQEEDGARSEYQGTGLGMSIVKGLVEQMGGTITVESQKGVGSSFTLRIPFEAAPAPTVQPAKEQSPGAEIRGVKLLVVEDNELNAEIAQMLLEDAGARVSLVTDGKQAVDCFQNHAPGTFDAILMDIMMPVMDGLEATKAIRALARPDAKTVPIIAMTANAFAEDAEKCFAAGMNAHLAKPLEMEKVKKTICELTGWGAEKRK